MSDLLDKSGMIKFRKVTDTPRVRQQTGRDPKTDNVGERIELHTEFRAGSCNAGDAPVQRVKKYG